MFASTRFKMIKEMSVDEMARYFAQNSVSCPASEQQDCKASQARTAKEQFNLCTRCWLDFLNEEIYYARLDNRPAEVRTIEYADTKEEKKQ